MHKYILYNTYYIIHTYIHTYIHTCVRCVCSDLPSNFAPDFPLPEVEGDLMVSNWLLLTGLFTESKASDGFAS